MEAVEVEVEDRGGQAQQLRTADVDAGGEKSGSSTGDRGGVEERRECEADVDPVDAEPVRVRDASQWNGSSD